MHAEVGILDFQKSVFVLKRFLTGIRRFLSVASALVLLQQSVNILVGFCQQLSQKIR